MQGSAIISNISNLSFKIYSTNTPKNHFCIFIFNPFLIVRLFSDHDYLVSAAGRLGLEAGQGLLDGDIVDNLSSGLETARGAYNFLADLS